MDKYQTQWRIDNGLPPPKIPQWYTDLYAVELLNDEEMVKWLWECGPSWGTIGDTHMRCLGRIDPSFRKAIKRGLINPSADRLPIRS